MSLTNYQPTHCIDSVREAVQSFVLDCGQKYANTNPTEPSKAYMGAISQLAMDYWLMGHRELTVERVFDSEFVEYHVIHATHASRASRGAKRGILRKVGRAINPDWDGHRDYLRYEGSACVQPYLQREIGKVYDWSRGGASEQQKHDRKLIFALGLGAGLTSGEMSGLRWRDITVDEVGVVVCVAGRVVPVIYDYAEELETMTGTADEYVLRPAVKGRRVDDVVSPTLCTTKAWEYRPAVRRMRVTWIREMLHAHVSDSVLCQAAGLQALGKYEHLRPEVSDDAVLSMRGLFHKNPEGEAGLRIV